MPARAEGYSWSLIYSTAKHGFSLKTLYREMAKIDTPILLVIQDTNGSVFGALTSHPLRTSDLFYGTGESFLFTFYPDFEKFGWTGHNQYFIKGNCDSLVIGAGKYVFSHMLFRSSLFHAHPLYPLVHVLHMYVCLCHQVSPDVPSILQQYPLFPSVTFTSV